MCSGKKQLTDKKKNNKLIVFEKDEQYVVLDI